MIVMGAWFKKTPAEVRAALANRETLVMFACKKGCAEKMLKTPANYRFPGKKTPLLEGNVEAMSADGSKILVSDGAGASGWVEFEACLFYFDVI